MPKICYVKKRFTDRTEEMIFRGNEIVEKYAAQGFKLTVRQIYYQFVAHDLFPDDRRWTWTGQKWVRDSNGTKNAEPNYKWLGVFLNNARLAGLIDWEAIEDRTRNTMSLPHWDSPKELGEAAARQYNVDTWAEQKFRPRVWIEKDALVGVIENVCSDLDVPYFSCRGYTSQSEMWSTAMDIQQEAESGKIPIIFHLGDHDPSGIDMSRDILDRMQMFMGGVELIRLALNQDQIAEYKTPPSPAKTTDTRYKAYIANFGDDSWELDALEPQVISDLISTNVSKLIDDKKWKKAIRKRNKGRKVLLDAVKGM